MPRKTYRITVRYSEDYKTIQEIDVEIEMPETISVIDIESAIRNHATQATTTFLEAMSEYRIKQSLANAGITDGGKNETQPG